MRKTELTVTRYQVPGGFYVDVIPQGGEVSFWLGHKDCDIQEKMFAASAPFAPAERWTTPPTSGKPGWRTDAAPES